MSEGRRLLGQILKARGVLREGQVQEALDEQRRHGGLFGQALIALGHCTGADVAMALAEQAGLETVDLERVTPTPQALGLVDGSTAHTYGVLPLRLEGGVLVVALGDPLNTAVLQDLSFSTGVEVRGAVGDAKKIRELVLKHYGEEESLDQAIAAAARAVQGADAETAAASQPVVRLLNSILHRAIRDRASDVHFEVFEREFRIRYRVDGALYEIEAPPPHLALPLVSRIKVMSNLDITETRVPQDGRIELAIDGRPVDLRVATLPSVAGEGCVMRVLDRSAVSLDLRSIGLSAENEAALRALTELPHGIVLVSGPTGSGKTTTLYSMLQEASKPDVKIITAEDPVEYDIDGISQLQVNEAQGFTFASALRSVLRQDPDIVLVGEIRDLETATIAIQAGLTGHFVFSTLHTNDAVSAVTRLRDMGVDSFKIGSVIKGVLAQRLVRRLCTRCAEPVPPEEIPEEARPPAHYTGTMTPMRPVGCKHCGGSGYKGRVAVMELFPIAGAVGRLIETGSPLGDLVKASRPFGMRTMWESGLDRYRRGLTSFDEIQRVLGEAEIHGTSATPAAPVATAPATPRPTDGARILLADDDASMRRLLRTVLEREGFEVAETIDGLETLDAIERGDLDLVILDHDMPNLTGLGVLEEMRARVVTAGIPVIMLTARTDDTELEALELGAQDFMTKPVQPRSLVARVKAVLKRTRME